jgi:hypothetical protein
MKGTFFSSDFIRDSNGELRLLEINTDTTTGYNSTLAYFDYSNFINILSENNITDVCIIYKMALQGKVVDHLCGVLETSAPFITNIEKIVVPADSIFPSNPEDSDTKFILRFAYDETAILDSEYAKGTLNLLKLFSDNNDNESIINYYHSSPINGTYNTLLNDNLTNPNNIPDVIVKPVVVDHKAFPLYKIGKSNLTPTERYGEFISDVATTNNIIQQYHISQSQIEQNIVTSVRVFKIVYGPYLELCDVAEYEAEAVFNLPTSIEVDDTKISNQLSLKHYYEFATNFIKNEKHGLLGEEMVVSLSGDEIPISTMVEGDSYPSYFVEGSPNTDDDDILNQWSFSGSELPSGSYQTTSVLIHLYEWQPFANEITKISFPNDEYIRIGGANRLLAYDSITNSIKYIPCNFLTTNHSIFDSTGNLVPIVNVEYEILETTETFYSPNMEDVDTFLIGGSKIIRLVSHNPIRGVSCFIAGTTVTMGDESIKNIEDVIIGDEVMSFNEITKEVEVKKVTNVKTPLHNDLVTYTLSDGRTITSTFDHPYYVNSTELASFDPKLTIERYDLGREIHEIKIGDTIQNLTDLTLTTIVDIKGKITNETQTYIITVEDNHNFYANGILVHNKV